MANMVSAIHPDFRDDVTKADARAADKETKRLIFEQQKMGTGDWARYIEIAHEMLRARLRAYNPDSPPIGGAYTSIGSGYLRAGMLEKAK